jgi:DNA-binding NarL/FixJ family response regulator
MINADPIHGGLQLVVSRHWTSLRWGGDTPAPSDPKAPHAAKNDWREASCSLLGVKDSARVPGVSPGWLTPHAADSFGGMMSDPGGNILVGAVDDHPLILRGLRLYFAESAPDILLDRIEPSVEALLNAEGAVPSVVLLDLLLPEEPDVAGNVRKLRAAGAQVVLLTSDSRPAVVHRALEAGAIGLALKGDPEQTIVEAVRAAYRGEPSWSSRLAYAIVNDPVAAVRLSRREREVLTGVAQGKPHRLIAKELNLSQKTLPTYLYRAMRRYTEAGRPAEGFGELAAFALRDGHLDPPAGEM